MSEPFAEEKERFVHGPRQEGVRLERRAGADVAPEKGISPSVIPAHKSMAGQEMVSDDELRAFFVSDKEEQLFYELLLRDYERVLFNEDAEGLAAQERETIHFMGRFVPHFDGNGDGIELLKSFRRDLERAVARAGQNRVLRIRYAYAVYHDHAAGRRRLREIVIGGYLADFLPIAQLKGAGRRLPPRRNSETESALPPAPGVVIRRWTLTPPGVTALGEGQLRVFTGQSKAALESMLRDGLQWRLPRHPGRAHYGRGVYTSQQKAIAEEYQTQHERQGTPATVAQATPRVARLQALNVAAGEGAEAFEAYLNNTPGLRQAWARTEENRFIIFEAFVQAYAPHVDLVIAPHGAGNQIVFRSPRALETLKLSVPR